MAHRGARSPRSGSSGLKALLATTGLQCHILCLALCSSVTSCRTCVMTLLLQGATAFLESPALMDRLGAMLLCAGMSWLSVPPPILLLFSPLSGVPAGARRSSVVPLPRHLVAPDLRHLMRTFPKLLEPPLLSLRSLMVSSSLQGGFLLLFPVVIVSRLGGTGLTGCRFQPIAISLVPNM